MTTKQTMVLCFLITGLGFLKLNAQDAILSTGMNASGSGGSVSYSIGQVCYQSQTSSGGTITQGVQQPYEFFTVSVSEQPGINQSISVYPNPSSDMVMLNVSQLNTDDLNYSLYDVQGKLIIKEKITNQTMLIQMNNLLKGVYFLHVYNSKNELKTIKIIKN